MIIDTVALERGIKVEFNRAMSSMVETAGASQAVEALVTRAPSGGHDEKYGWLGDLPSVKEWVGDKTAGSITDYNYTLTNKDYYNAIEIDRNELDDDRMGIIKPRIQSLVFDIKQYQFELIENLIKNGATGLAYDAAAYFSDRTSPNDNNLVGLSSTAAAIRPYIYTARKAMFKFVSDTSRVMKLAMDTIVVPPDLEGVMLEAVMSSVAADASVSGIYNPLKGWIKQVIVSPLQTTTDAWYGFCCNRPLRPFILQTRKEPTPVLDDSEVKRNRKLVFSAEMRCVAGYGFFQMGVKTAG